MDLDAYFAENPQMADAGVPAAPEGFRSGFIALVGRPNAGKSTLMNALVGQKVAITSATPQTTRRNVQGVLTLPACQMVFVDTPGLHKPHDLLGEHLNGSAEAALKDVDVVAMLVDSTKPVGRGDAWVAEHVAASPAKKMLVLSQRTRRQPSSKRHAAWPHGMRWCRFQRRPDTMRTLSWKKRRCSCRRGRCGTRRAWCRILARR